MLELSPNINPHRCRAPQCSNCVRTNKLSDTTTAANESESNRAEESVSKRAEESVSKRSEDSESKRAEVSEITNQTEESRSTSLQSVATIANSATGCSSSDAVMERAKVESESKRRAVESDLN